MQLPDRPRRSALYLPASNARALAKARTLDVDVVILDLEDSIAPDNKVDARDAARRAAEEGGWGRRELLVRINAIGTPWHSDDLAMVRDAHGVAGVVVPKVSGPGDIQQLDAALATTVADLAIWAMIETCAAVGDLPAIARVGQQGRLAGLVMGFNDLAKEMRAEPDAGRAVFLPFLAQAVAAARTSGLVVLDGVCNAIADLARLEAECRQGLMFGVDGKTLIHPAQIAPCHAVFTPAADAVARAERIVAAFGAPDASGKGVVLLDGEMVELLHLEQAKRLLTVVDMIASG